MKMTVKARRLNELTEIARQGLGTAAKAVFEIHEEKLYLETHDTFDQWLWDTLRLKRSRGYELIESYKGRAKLELLPPMSGIAGHQVSDRAATEIAKVPDEQLPEVLEKATEGGSRPPTAASVKRAAEEVQDAGDAKPEPKKPETDGEKFRKLKSIARQHNAAMMRAIDDMQKFTRNVAPHRALLRLFEQIDAGLEGWK
jgi:ribosomal protein L12E/L44/L45/RPP1/RPP2